MNKPTALVLIFDGVEEMEATAPIDLLRRAGVEVTVASAFHSREVKGRNGIRLVADKTLSDCRDLSVDLLVLPGGPGHANLLDHESLQTLLRQQEKENKWIGSICAGPVVLKQAGILEGRRFTSFPGTQEKLPERIPDQTVVVDGKLITSLGAGTATHFALALVEALCGAGERASVADSICFPDPG